KGKRAPSIGSSLLPSGSPLDVQLKSDVVTFKAELASGSYSQATNDVLIHSYFDGGKTWTSNIVSGPAATTRFVQDTVFTYNFQTTHKKQDQADLPATLEIAIAGLRSGTHRVHISVGPDAQATLR